MGRIALPVREKKKAKKSRRRSTVTGYPALKATGLPDEPRLPPWFGPSVGPGETSTVPAIRPGTADQNLSRTAQGDYSAHVRRHRQNTPPTPHRGAAFRQQPGVREFIHGRWHVSHRCSRSRPHRSHGKMPQAATALYA
ncbi:hypothetical protein HPP92_029024 [Vanilla planifolia]|uniref:Uncharacterized protein n=1 Tax=Vanilla planifolia TaxID=51239 RepID=A0A835P3B0_VANPL|nr:hypothetical protein HPP92_029012 [Vanilla planifolia]KAG0446075.1 hypothetical protein HPP92_029024 [Vanilla planifolia]